jgi:hypothetical protein
MVDDGRLLAERSGVRSPEQSSLASASKKSHSHFWSWPVDHYKAGLISGLLFLDFLALSVGFLDIGPSLARDFPLAAVWEVANNPMSEVRAVDGVPVLGFFLIVVPFLLGLLPKVYSTSDMKNSQLRLERREGAAAGQDSRKCSVPSSAEPRWQSFLLARGGMVVASHFILVTFILILTLGLESMRALSGPENNSLSYSFPSYWLTAVFGIKWLSTAVIVPVLLRFAPRLLGHEKHPGEALIDEVADLGS